MGTESYRFSVGTFACIAVRDGTFAYPDPAHLFFANAPKERLAQALRAHDLQPEQWTEHVSPFTCLAIDTGRHRVLVDTGLGAGLVPTTGRLLQNLAAEGIRPEDIDTVILTHGHPDHIGGITDGQGKPAFPNARCVMWRSEWDFWTGEPDLARLTVPEQIKQLMLMFARNSLPPIRGQIDLIDREAEIVPGVRAIAAPGHTPAHMALAISSDGEQLLYAVDTALHPIQVEHPDWYAGFDFLPDQTVATRRRLFDWAATEEALVLAYHFPFPGLGHVIREGEGWRWQPVATTE